METINTLKIGERVDSPLPGFNNFMLEIGNDLSEIYDYDVYGTNNCLFSDESILLFGCIKLLLNNNEMAIKFTDIIDSSNLDLIQKTLDNRYELSTIFFRYLFVLNDVRNNYDTTVSYKYIEDIYNSIMEKKEKINLKYFLVPYKNKILKDIDKLDKTLENLIAKFTYVLSVKDNFDKSYKCSLIRILSSDLDENLSIENIRPLEKEKLKEVMVQQEGLKTFLLKLMCYGEI